MEPEWQSHGISPNMADFLSDAELAFALQEEEVALLSNPIIQQPRPSIPFSHGMENYDDLGEADLTKECQICSEEKHTDLYPHSTAESDCSCLSDVCLICMQQHIKSQTESKEWKEGSLTCPICNRPLVPQEIEEYADGDTLKTQVDNPYLQHDLKYLDLPGHLSSTWTVNTNLDRHLSHMIDQTVKDIPDFTRCPNPDCDSGQVHEGGDAHPLVTCAACNTQFCFRHGIKTQSRPEQAPSQHENMTCDEYDRYIAEPMTFRSEHQRQQERAAVESREVEAVARARERMEKILERRREAGGATSAVAVAAEESRRRREENKRQRVEHAARDGRERRERGERKRQERGEHRERERQEREELKEREQREERARLEERRYEEEREKAELERKARAEEILQRKAEDEQSEWLIGVSTKGCPQCAKRIEKNEGCMHMTCPCGHEFCWECTGPWVANSCAHCFGGPVVQFE